MDVSFFIMWACINIVHKTIYIYVPGRTLLIKVTFFYNLHKMLTD